MQKLKPGVKSAIINSAVLEFYQKGFEKSSMRAIAQGANIAVGNIYKYFTNKEELFSAVVSPVYLQFKGILHHPHKHDGSQLDFRVALNLITRFFAEKRETILILIDRSQGTKFAQSKQEFIMFMEKNIKEHIQAGEKISSIIIRPLAVCVIEGFISILKNYSNKPLIQKLSAEFIRFFLAKKGHEQ